VKKYFDIHYGSLRFFQDNSESGGVDGSSRSGSRGVTVVVTVVACSSLFFCKIKGKGREKKKNHQCGH
jgi:hypothetical protein